MATPAGAKAAAEGGALGRRLLWQPSVTSSAPQARCKMAASGVFAGSRVAGCGGCSMRCRLTCPTLAAWRTATTTVRQHVSAERNGWVVSQTHHASRGLRALTRDHVTSAVTRHSTRALPPKPLIAFRPVSLRNTIRNRMATHVSSKTYRATLVCLMGYTLSLSPTFLPRKWKWIESTRGRSTFPIPPGIYPGLLSSYPAHFHNKPLRIAINNIFPIIVSHLPYILCYIKNYWHFLIQMNMILAKYTHWELSEQSANQNRNVFW